MFLARGGGLIEDAAVESGVLIALGQRRVAEPSDPLEAPACDGARAVARLDPMHLARDRLFGERELGAAPGPPLRAPETEFGAPLAGFVFRQIMRRVSVSRAKFKADLAVGMGGRVAEELIFGYEKVTSGASSL